ncbi:MAG: pyridoxamine 5'-phosphate oxidase family protein [Ignavibacteria bacterium]|nr:pyridoxamine 5'-phosphate oxidase family protein [Ignavibacteria bacterium]
MSVKDKKKITEIMKKNCMHAYLATCDGKRPRVRPVSPIIGDDMSIWVGCNNVSRKVKQIKKNRKICLSFVELPQGNRSATVVGSAKIVTNLTEKKQAWKLAPYNMSEHFPKGVESKEFCLLKVVPDFIEWRESWTTKLKIYKPK